MGYAKNVIMPEMERRGYYSRESYVCGECLNDSALAQVVEDNTEKTKCDYCDEERDTEFTASLIHVIDHMADCILQDWTDPVEELPFESAEGGYQGRVLTGFDLLIELDFDPKSQDIFDEVVQAFSDHDWCEQDYFSLTPFQRLEHGWEDFKRVVMHHRRYTFWSIKQESMSEFDPDYMPVGKMLAVIGNYISEHRLIKLIDRGTAIWRVRVHEECVPLTQDHHLSSPPIDNATQANRMSPAGVSMFYGAEDFETACLETIDPNRTTNKQATGVIFRTVRELRLLDLVDLPTVPSYFESGNSDRRVVIAFLNHFSQDIAKRIERDKKQHIEYVPSQAFTEYIRYELQLEDTSKIDGIRFRSSMNGHTCYVLFCTQENCIVNPQYRDDERWLEFDETSLKTIDAHTVVI